MTAALTSSRKRSSGCVRDSSQITNKRRRIDKAVRFSTEVAEHKTSSYLSGLNPVEEEELRSKLWYSQNDFQNFHADRTQTIQLCTAVGGNASLLEPNYCLRGLETFQELLTSNEMQAIRSKHLAAVLNEQEQQRSSSNLDPERVADASRNVTFWAKERAMRFAAKDAEEVLSYQMSTKSTTVPLSTKSFKSLDISLVKEKSLATSNSATYPLIQMLPTRLSMASAASRESLANMGFLGGASYRSINRGVDVSKLKQLNLQFLRGLTQGTNAAPASHQGTLDLLNEALRFATDDF